MKGKSGLSLKLIDVYEQITGNHLDNLGNRFPNVEETPVVLDDGTGNPFIPLKFLIVNRCTGWGYCVHFVNVNDAGETVDVRKNH
jgi:hypothetical protein